MNKLKIKKLYRSPSGAITGLLLIAVDDNDNTIFEFPIPRKALAHTHNIEEGREIKLTCAY
jgi:hypothetical protein